MAYSTITKPTDYFNTVTYTGNGSTQSITGVGFQPDWVWIKERGAANNHELYDVVRGVTKRIYSDLTNAEDTNSTGLTAFGADGFTLGGAGGTNNNSDTYVAWNWKAGGAGSSNSDGSITSTVSANTTAGFSIVTWTAPSSGSNTDTIGHGLSAVPKMIIARTTSASDGWRVYHHVPGIDKLATLNNTNAFNSNTNIFPTLPTTSIFYPGSDSSINSSSRTYVAYCFAEKPGYSKFGSYSGNGNADGAFVYTGFKPTWVMIKNQTSGSYKSWSIFDTTRQTFNPNVNKTLYANRNEPEGRRGDGSTSSTIPSIDMLSNGFKCRVLNDEVNTTNDYIYMAFGQSLVGTNNIPATAR